MPSLRRSAFSESIAFCLSGKRDARSSAVCHCDEPVSLSIAMKAGALAGTIPAAPPPDPVAAPHPAARAAEPHNAATTSASLPADIARSLPPFGAAVKARMSPAALEPARLRVMELEVRVAGRDRPDKIPITEGMSPHEELARFLNRQGPYAQMWIRLASGEDVRYDLIESVADPNADDPAPEPG